ncbi:MAG: DNA gyrase inhibitor YacG [Planctomycetota bacterium]
MSVQKPKGGCPICGKPNLDEEGKPIRHFPFCSSNCKMIDLDNWLSGRYFERLIETTPPSEQDDISDA